jgi:Polyglycine hydrolase-like, structural repeat
MPEWHAYHGRSSAQHQAEFDDLSGRGFRMISLSVYGNPNNLRYAGVWSLRSDPAFIAFHGKTEAEYQQLFDQHTGRRRFLRAYSRKEPRISSSASAPTPCNSGDSRTI